MATKEEIQQLLDAIKGALSAKFDENDKRFTTLINGLRTQFFAQESRFSTLEQVVQQNVNPAVSYTDAPVHHIMYLFRKTEKGDLEDFNCHCHWKSTMENHVLT